APRLARMDQANSKSNANGNANAGSAAERPTSGWNGPTAIMAILAAAFLFRVFAQLIQSLWPTPALPSFEAWQGSGLPYPVLLASQAAIVAAMGWAIGRRLTGRAVFAPGLHRAVFWLAIVYFVSMAARLLGGLIWLSDVIWFSRPLPAVYHMVLALFLVASVLWDDRLATGPRTGIARWIFRAASYPSAMAIGFTVFAAAAGAGISAATAAVLAVTAGATLVVLHELIHPYRAWWRPSARELVNDLAYLVLVQMLLPRVLGFGVVMAAAALAAEPGQLLLLWPHHWPASAQAVLMLLTAEFMRYWLHRAAHNYRPLWRLHAVHHAPTRLYAINVARFHPLEKSLQYVFDALPFLLLGVSPEVMSAYFVFYAINGFYQHSNCDIRLGPLNYVISGPELHRWHHSMDIGESNRNYGNNLIVWDILFGTFFWPRDREVGRLGLEHHPIHWNRLRDPIDRIKMLAP
ncbi:MAG: sterol desaturase family protein, partial [Alphaproteobacteria bacterium]|nr:sterol desaturase family protein [Alphaproteobacteria bacterium]